MDMATTEKQNLKTPTEYLKEPYARILTPNGAGGFTAEILEFPGCITEGDTAEEAIMNLEEAAAGWIEGMLEHENEIVEPMNNDGYSGKFPLRLPRSLHRRTARLAERDNVSLNTLLVALISAGAGVEEFSDRRVHTATVDVKIINAHHHTNVNTAFYSLPNSTLYAPEGKKVAKPLKNPSSEVTRNA